MKSLVGRLAILQPSPDSEQIAPGAHAVVRWREDGQLLALVGAAFFRAFGYGC